MPIKCPKCDAEEFFYVQDATQYHQIGKIHEDGNVDLLMLSDSFPHEEFHFRCEGCDVEVYNTEEYFNILKGKIRLTQQQAEKLQPGDEVYHNDTLDVRDSRVLKIGTIQIEDNVCKITEQDGYYLECLVEDLS